MPPGSQILSRNQYAPFGIRYCRPLEFGKQLEKRGERGHRTEDTEGIRRTRGKVGGAAQVFASVFPTSVPRRERPVAGEARARGPRQIAKDGGARMILLLPTTDN
jgi:hypothetical protein